MPIKMEWIESSKTLALKAQMLGDYPKNTIRYTEFVQSSQSYIATDTHNRNT